MEVDEIAAGASLVALRNIQFAGYLTLHVDQGMNSVVHDEFRFNASVWTLEPAGPNGTLRLRSVHGGNYLYAPEGLNIGGRVIVSSASDAGSTWHAVPVSRLGTPITLASGRDGKLLHVEHSAAGGTIVLKGSADSGSHWILERVASLASIEGFVADAREACEREVAAARAGDRGAKACWGFAAPLHEDAGLPELYTVPEEGQTAGGCASNGTDLGTEVETDLKYGIAFDPGWVVYRRPPDDAEAFELPPTCDVERRFWGHHLNPGSPEPQRLCIWVDCLSAEERLAAEQTWASVASGRVRHRDGRPGTAEPWVSIHFMPCMREVRQGRILAQGVIRWVFEALFQMSQVENRTDCDWHVFVPTPSYVDVLAIWEHLSCYPSGAELWWLSTRMDIASPSWWSWPQHPYAVHALSRVAVPMASYTVRDGVCTMALLERPHGEAHLLKWKISCCVERPEPPCYETEELFAFCCGVLRLGVPVHIPGEVLPPRRRLRSRRRFLEGHSTLLRSLVQVPPLARKLYEVEFLTAPFGHMDDNYVLNDVDNLTNVLDPVVIWNITTTRLSPSAVHAGHEPGCAFIVHPVSIEGLHTIHALRARGAGRTSSCAPQAVIDRHQQTTKSLHTLVRCGDHWMALRHGKTTWDGELHPAKCAVLARLPKAHEVNESQTISTWLARTCCLLPRGTEHASLAGFTAGAVHEFWRNCFDEHFTPTRCCSLPTGEGSWEAGCWVGASAPPTARAADGRSSVMLMGLPRSGTTWLSYVLAAAFDLKEGLRRTCASQRLRLRSAWVRRLRRGVRKSAMIYGGRFLHNLYRTTFGRGRSSRPPSSGVFVHEFFVPGQYFRWGHLDRPLVDTGFGDLPYFTRDVRALAHMLMRIGAVMGASFYTNFHNMLRERVPPGSVDGLVEDIWKPSGFRVTKEVQMTFRVREFAKHFRVFGLFRHRHMTFPSSAPQIFMSLYQSIQLNDYVDPRNRLVRVMVLELADTFFDKIVLAHTAASLFALRNLLALGAPVLRWEELIALDFNSVVAGGSSPASQQVLSKVVRDVLGPALGLDVPLLVKVLQAMVWPGAWGIGAADQDLKARVGDEGDFKGMTVQEWLRQRRERYFSFPGAEETEGKVVRFLRYMLEVDPHDVAASLLM